LSRRRWRRLRVPAGRMIAIFDSRAGGGEFGVDVARGIQAEMPDLDEAARQDVQKKSAHKFQDHGIHPPVTICLSASV